MDVRLVTLEHLLSLSYRLWRWSLPIAVLAVLWGWLNLAAFILLIAWRGIVALSLLLWLGVGLTAVMWLFYPLLVFHVGPRPSVETQWMVGALREGVDEWQTWFSVPARVLRLLTGWGGLVLAGGLFLSLPFADRITDAEPSQIARLVFARMIMVTAAYILAATLGALLALGWGLVSRAWHPNT